MYYMIEQMRCMNVRSQNFPSGRRNMQLWNEGGTNNVKMHWNRWKFMVSNACIYVCVCVCNLTYTDVCMEICVCVYVYSSPPLALRDMFPDPQWMSETIDNTKPYIYYVFFLYKQTYDKV